jgi:hypothetical protein
MQLFKAFHVDPTQIISKIYFEMNIIS